MFMQIQNAQLSDLRSINQLLRTSKAYWHYDDDFMNYFMEKFAITYEYLKINPTKLFLVDRTLAGFYSFSLQQDGILELDNFFLHPNYIGKKLGCKLWSACCKTAKELKQKEFILWSDPGAEGFYLKMGCGKIGVRESPMMLNRYPAVMKYKIP